LKRSRIVRPDVAGLTFLTPAEMAVTGILIEGNDDRFMEVLAKALVLSSLAKRPVPTVRTDRPDGSLEVRIRPKGQQIINKKDKKVKCPLWTRRRA
jgi:hypothetical protein